jgi:hypothetical protein
LAEEFVCARAIDEERRVKHWVRNVERDERLSFWLPTSTDYFYPDFVAELTDGRVLAVEYKGRHLLSGDDTREKVLVGKQWQVSSTGRCVFLLATIPDADVAGRSLEQQVEDAIEGRVSRPPAQMHCASATRTAIPVGPHFLADATMRGDRPGGDLRAERHAAAAQAGFWRYSLARLSQLENEGRLVFGPNGRPRVKRYLSEVRNRAAPNTDEEPVDSNQLAANHSVSFIVKRLMAELIRAVAFKPAQLAQG